MQGSIRPYATAGIFLLGASVIAVTPVAPPADLGQGSEHISHAAVRLADADALTLPDLSLADLGLPDLTLQDLENIPYNFLASIINLPYQEFAEPISTDSIADGQLAYTTVPDADGGVGVTPIPETSLGDVGLLDNVLAYEGNFFLLNAVNVLGIDPGDPGKVAAFSDILAGNPDIGSAVSAELIPIVEAELPLVAGCTAASAGGCPDPLELLTGYTLSDGVTVPGYFSVPIQDFFSATGYTFPGTAADPLTNPVPSGEPIPPGIVPGTPTDPIPLTGDEYYGVLPWSGETVNFNDFTSPGTAYFDYLTQSPADNPIEFPSLQDVTTDLSNLATGVFNTLNPFVPGTYCFICAPFVPGDTSGLDLGSLSTDVTQLFDSSTLLSDLSALPTDLGALPSDLTSLPLDLSSLLTTTLPDLFSSI